MVFLILTSWQISAAIFCVVGLLEYALFHSIGRLQP
jgi:hypothetical protein